MDVVRTYLELTAPHGLRPAGPPAGDVSLARVHTCPPSHYRALYAAVGEAYHWRDRLAWSDARLAEHLADPRVAVWTAVVRGETAGYFELVRHSDGSVEIAYFGLLPAFHGRGLGKWLLTRATEEAWAMGANRVWLQTCTLDHPAALPNYEARGFVPFHRETYRVAM
jgi:GNAT superfamily N-acetyltransferase